MTESPEKTEPLHLQVIADEDVVGLLKAQESYGDSWKKRGGAGAFFMLARKWDRLELRVSQRILAPHEAETSSGLAAPYDIFAHCAADERTEGIIDDIRDLRRYLLLVEAELRARNIVHGSHRDNS